MLKATELKAFGGIYQKCVVLCADVLAGKVRGRGEHDEVEQSLEGMWGPMMELEDSSFNQGVPAQNRCTLGSHDIFALPFWISSRIQLHWSLEQRGQSQLDM